MRIKKISVILIVVIMVLSIDFSFAETGEVQKSTTVNDSTEIQPYNDPDDHYVYRKKYKDYKEKTVTGFLARQNPEGYKLSGYLTYIASNEGGVSVSFSFPKPFSFISYTVPMGEYSGSSNSGVGCAVAVPDNKNFYKLKATKKIRVTPWIMERRSIGSKKWRYYTKGYKEQIRSEEYYCVPIGTKISKIKAGSKKFTVSWKANKYTGYQISYSDNSKMTGAKNIKVSAKKTSKTIDKLGRKKKYYVRIRTYKTYKGTIRYSTWSGKKSVTTK